MPHPAAPIALIPEHALVRVRALHASIDDSAARLTALHEQRLQCRRGCNDCCVDDLEVSLVEAARIARDHESLLASGQPGPRGRCAMLGPEGECRVYASRPYICRTQGLPLRWTDPESSGREVHVERRDECPKNQPPPGSSLAALEDLPATACWTLGAAEKALAALATIAGAGEGRISLRLLFASPVCASPARTDDVVLP